MVVQGGTSSDIHASPKNVAFTTKMLLPKSSAAVFLLLEVACESMLKDLRWKLMLGSAQIRSWIMRVAGSG